MKVSSVIRWAAVAIETMIQLGQPTPIWTPYATLPTAPSSVFILSLGPRLIVGVNRLFLFQTLPIPSFLRIKSFRNDLKGS